MSKQIQSLFRLRARGAFVFCVTSSVVLLLFATSMNLPLGQPASDAPVEVGVIGVELRKTTVPREYVGRIDAEDTVEIRARIEGFLDKQLFKDGAVVKQGELLFLIDPREYEAAVAEARARLARARADLVAAEANVELIKAKADLVRDKASFANAEKDLGRIRPLAEASAVSMQELDQAETKMKEAAAVVDASEAVVRQAGVNKESGVQIAKADVLQTSAALATTLLNLSYTRLTAPIDGLIGKGEVNVGSLVGKGDASLLATISRLDIAKVYFSLSEQEYMSIMRERQAEGVKEGDVRAQFELVLSDGKLFDQKGRFEYAERAVDEKTGTLQLRAAFPNPDHLLRPGQFGRVRVTNPNAPPSLMIPQRAVQEQQGEQFVLVVDGQGKVERRKIKLGARVESMWIVNDGLQEGEQVITDGLQKARDGMTVRVLKTSK